MVQENYALRRRTSLVLTTSWCALLTLPALAAQRIEPGDQLPAASELPLLDGANLLAETAPVTPAIPDPSAAAAVAAPVEPVVTRPRKSASVTINLINRMVEKGLLTKEDAADLIQQAENDAAEARLEAQATHEAAQQAVAAAQTAAIQAAAAAQAVPPPAPPLSDDDMRVTYIPEVVKAQIRDEIKREIMAKAKNENWAVPNAVPEWVSRIKLFGDIRTRYEGIFFPEGNDNTGGFPNFNAINTGSPFDIAGTVFPPTLNVDQDRKRFRIRLRFGADIDLGDGFTAGLRLATGDSNSPVSTNQSLGASGSNFSKYAIWLDRAFLKYELGGQPNKNLAVTLGRFDNPFFGTDIIWDDDLGFDGAAIQAKYEVLPGLTPFLTMGAFPIYNTDLNFSSIRPAKFPSDDRYLYGAQLGVNWKINKDFNFKLGAAYYDFRDIQGELSDPFVPLTAQDNGSTDGRRPAFAQKGNTYMALRRIVPTIDNDFGTSKQFQYFGLATGFRDLALTARLDYNHFEPFQVSIMGEYIRNLAFDRQDIEAKAINNRTDSTGTGLAPYDGGDTAWIVGVKVGNVALDKRWNWNFGMNYRHVESDAVVDGFADSDFGGGGTNVKGFSIYGALALSPRVYLGLRWMSSDEIAGPPLKNDILQVDIGGKF